MVMGLKVFCCDTHENGDASELDTCPICEVYTSMFSEKNSNGSVLRRPSNETRHSFKVCLITLFLERKFQGELINVRGDLILHGYPKGLLEFLSCLDP